MNQMFEVYISRLGEAGASTGTSIILPATPCEILDRLERARINKKGMAYSTEVMDCELEYLPQFMAPCTDIYELDHLAQRLCGLNKWQLQCVKGMVMMDAIKPEYKRITVERLINFTHSTSTCQIVNEAHDDGSLGKFYVDYDFPVIPENLPEELFEMLDYESIGRKARVGEGGVFTEKGYVVQNEEIAQIYRSGDAIPLEKPDYMVLLKVTKGYSADPEYNNGLFSYLKLPANDSDLDRAIAKIEAESEKECTFSVADCRIPWLAERLSDFLEEDAIKGYGKAAEFANQLRRLSQRGELTTYKAMLEVSPNDLTMEEAIDLSYQTAGLSVIQDATSPADYAKQVLSQYNIEKLDELLACTNLHQYGEKLMEEKEITMTEFGALWPLDGQTVERMLDRSKQSQGIEMK